ncbi:MAG: hypothetical protein CFE22_05165 [Cytophagaceae bacterium BCCC1]|nr:hypothetical protein [Lacihabitans sp. CS3-21]OYU67262.1 MAG: hypothetical protein CFE22_05165 [Cytophagaceae bacterium BCCC1]
MILAFSAFSSKLVWATLVQEKQASGINARNLIGSFMILKFKMLKIQNIENQKILKQRKI